MNILFWNIENKDTARPLIASAVAEHEIDVVVLAEATGFEEPWLVPTLAAFGPYRPVHLNSRLRAYIRAPLRLRPIREANCYSICSLQAPVRDAMLLVLAHLPSKRYRDSDDQVTIARGLSDLIRESEAAEGHERTLVVGDLNANPFEPALVKADALHSVMSQKIARKGSRVFDSRSYSYFYNPMWSLMGDLSTGPPGTWYGGTSHAVSYFWNTFDQCLLRPSLLDHFDRGGVAVLDRIGVTDLASDERIHGGVHPDHLPLVVRLNW